MQVFEGGKEGQGGRKDHDRHSLIHHIAKYNTYCCNGRPQFAAVKGAKIYTLAIFFSQALLHKKVFRWRGLCQGLVGIVGIVVLVGG